VVTGVKDEINMLLVKAVAIAALNPSIDLLVPVLGSFSCPVVLTGFPIH